MSELESALFLRDGKDYLVMEKIILRLIEHIQSQVDALQIIDVRNVIFKALQQMIVSIQSTNQIIMRIYELLFFLERSNEDQLVF